MKNSFSYKLLLLCMLPFMAACSSDSDGGQKGADANVNANTTEKSTYATRMEVPHLHQGNAYQLLVKTDATYGVNYMVEWDLSKRAQRWTCWEWNSTNAVKNWNRNNWSSGTTFNGFGGNGDPFQPDPEIDAAYRSELSDYSGSGYNRGHMCASEDRICNQNCNGQTFYLSNMQPQIYGFNSGVWENMEIKLRSWRDTYVKQGATMYVCKGGTIGDVSLSGQTKTGVISASSMRIPVPKYFFMAVLIKTTMGYNAMAFWAEHKADNSTNLEPYMITIDELEARTGYDFFCNLPDNIESIVESTLVKSEWK